MNELTISLDPHRKTPLYEQIYGFIREEIRGGRIRAGERLPSARALSGYLSVSRSTVDLAYEQLVSEGYLESVPCKGYFVCEIEGLYRLDEKKEETKEDDAAEQMPFRYDFAVTGTAPGGFPQNSWKKISKEVLLDADDSLFQLGDAKGEHGLREAIRDYLHHARGVNCRTEQIIVGAGNDYLLMLLSVILGRGHKVAMGKSDLHQCLPLFCEAWLCDVYDFDGRSGHAAGGAGKKRGGSGVHHAVAPVPDGHGHADEAADAAPCVGIEGKWAVSD